MALIKCPRCELNYMQDTDKICSVCRREVRGESEQDEVIELCSECGENPVVPGQELCAYCLKELARRSPVSTDDTIPQATANIEIDSVSTMDEIDIGGGMDNGGYDFSDDEDEEDKDKDDEDEDDEEDEDDDDDDDDGE